MAYGIKTEFGVIGPVAPDSPNADFSDQKIVRSIDKWLVVFNKYGIKAKMVLL